MSSTVMPPAMALLALLLVVLPWHGDAAGGIGTDEVEFDFKPFAIKFKSGKVQRLMGLGKVPPPNDAQTESKDVVIDAKTGVTARVYRPAQLTDGALPVLLYFHGGGFVVETPMDGPYSHYVAALAAKAGAVAVSVNYRLAPENPLPAAYDDAWAALGWVSEKSDPWIAENGDLARLFVAGDSAGGNIAHNLVMRAGRDGGAAVAGLALLNPYFLSSPGDPFSNKAWSFVCAGKYGLDDPQANPMVMKPAEWQKLGTKRVFVSISGSDSLRPNQEAYVKALKGSGWKGTVEVLETPGVGHCFFINHLEQPKEAKHMEAVAAFIDKP